MRTPITPFLGRPILGWLALATVTALLLLPGIYDRLAFYDEGIVLAGAERVLGGEAPYVDFWTQYPPGQFYLLALVFKLAGKSLIVERLYDLVIKVLICLVAYRLVRDLSSRGYALGAWGMLLVWLGYSRYSSYPIYPALLAVLVGMVCLLRHLDTRHNVWLDWCAAAVVVAVLFRHDVGAMAGVSFATLLLLAARWRSLARYTMLGLAGATVVAIGLELAFGLERVFAHLIAFPSEVYRDYRWVPYPDSASPGFLAFYILPAVVAAGVATTATCLGRRRFDGLLIQGIGTLSLFGAASLALLRVRSDSIHLLPCAVAAIVMAPLLMAFWHRSLVGRRRWHAVASVAMGLVMATALGYALYAQFEMLERIADGRGGVPSGLRGVVEYVRSNTVPGDALYSGVTNHDQFVVSAAAANFLTGRAYATRYHELHPGLTNTRPVQEIMVAELEASSPPLVILATHNWKEPNLSSVDTGVDVLDRYIRANYRFEQRYGLFEVWVLDRPSQTKGTGR